MGLAPLGAALHQGERAQVAARLKALRRFRARRATACSHGRQPVVAWPAPLCEPPQGGDRHLRWRDLCRRPSGGCGDWPCPDTTGLRPWLHASARRTAGRGLSRGASWRHGRQAALRAAHMKRRGSELFKHVVNLFRIHGFNSVNLRLGCPMLEVWAPLEILPDE